MHNITIPLSEQFLASLKFLGADNESSQMDLTRRLIAEYMDDLALGATAVAAGKEGYAGTEAGKNWLQSLKNAKD